MGTSVTTFYDAMDQLYRERLARRDFDTFLVIDTHWFTTVNYILNAAARLSGLYTSDEVPELLREYAYDHPGDPELAEAIVTAAGAASLRAIAQSRPGMPVHYPTLNTMHYFNPQGARRVLSMGVCQTASVENDLAFARAIASGIAASSRRVVLVAAGGLSHHFWEYDHIVERAGADPSNIYSAAHREFDERIMELFRRGDHQAVLRLAGEYRKSCQPEGRFSHYLLMAGALGGGGFTSPGLQYGRYEAALGTGQAIFWFDVG